MLLAQWRTRRARAKQKRTALQMLALSGVVRPGYIEPRYSVPLIKLKELNQTHTWERPAPVPPSTRLEQPSTTWRFDGTQFVASLTHFSLPQLFRRFDNAGTAQS